MCYFMFNCFVNKNNNEPEKCVVKEKIPQGFDEYKLIKAAAFVLSWLLR